MLNIAITQSINYFKENNETRDTIDQRLISWLLKTGNLPFTFPNGLIESDNSKYITKWLEQTKIQGLILSGGNNLGEYKIRDETEKHLLKWAVNKSIPILGICRGMQMISNFYGVEIIKCKNHVNVRHKLKINRKGKIFTHNVNSFHDNSIEKCPSNFEIMAQETDGVIEAIKHKYLKIECWMWHPEREKIFSEIDINNFNDLLNE